jgi:hypothetical protein
MHVLDIFLDGNQILLQLTHRCYDSLLKHGKRIFQAIDTRGISLVKWRPSFLIFGIDVGANNETIFLRPRMLAQ